MAHFRYLSFLTDYGLEDGFVAACHGVGARIAPHADIIDVTHLVPPGDIRRGAAVLAQTVPYLPPAVHVAVVDPGVGTARRGIAVAAGDSVFIGPDNGLLSWAVAAAGGAARAFSLTNRELWLSRVTPTFHGRDIFMPVAAHLAADAELAAAGEEIDVGDLVTLPAPERMVRDFTAAGEVLTVDRFGNVQLSVTGADAAEIGVKPGGTVLVRLGHRQLTLPYRDTFGAVATGELVATPTAPGWSRWRSTAGTRRSGSACRQGRRYRSPRYPKLFIGDAFHARRPRGTITTGRVGTSPPQASSASLGGDI